MKQIRKIPKDFTSIGTFSGCGGSSTGHKAAGMDVLYANEFIPAAQDTYALNHPNTYLDRRDVRLVQAKEILKIIGLKKGDDDFRSFINDVLEAAVEDGSWAKAWENTAGTVLPTPEPPPVDRY